jgi:hypothetical protein
MPIYDYDDEELRVLLICHERADFSDLAPSSVAW